MDRTAELEAVVKELVELYDECAPDPSYGEVQQIDVAKRIMATLARAKETLT